MTRDGDDIEVTVSMPVTELALPPSPGFLARFLSWFGHKESVEKVNALIDGKGRILLRQSGTEPVVRVMVEAESHEKCVEYTEMVVDAIKNGGHVVE